MKTTCMLSLPFVFSAAVIAQADTSVEPISNLTFAHRTNLIDTDQSQTFETLSVADEFSRLPVSAYKETKVYFITNDKGQVFSNLGNGNNGEIGSQEFEDPTIKQCTGEGYKYNASNCANGFPVDTCPYNTGYFKTCCDMAYNYTTENCSLLNTTSSCGGKYKCDCSPEKYPATANSCPSPQFPTKESGSSCVVNGEVRYTKCVCPTGVDAPHGCETYYAGACSTVCKTAYSDNCRNRESVQTPYGCEKYFADCGSKCEKAYTDNCRNRIDVPTSHGCEQYYGDCQSKCEKAYADNCRNRTAVDSSAFGCQKYFADCGSKCEKAYTDNCHNRIDVPTPHGCEQYYGDCQSKCEKAYADNCRNRTAVSSSKFGCEKYFADCGSKCEKAYEDNCHNQVAVVDACPAGATCKYFSDCSSKVKEFTCERNFEQSDTACLFPLPVVYGDGTVTREYLSGPAPIAVVFDEANKLAVAFTDIKSDGSAAESTNTYMRWSTKQNDISSLTNCTNISKGWLKDGDGNVGSCGVDGRANTDKILACGSACGETPAATACNLYNPSGCTADFCKKGKWFLPSMRDLTNMSKQEDLTSTTLKLLGGNTYWDNYWSSNEYGKGSSTSNILAWVMNVGSGYRTTYSQNAANVAVVRPIIKY